MRRGLLMLAAVVGSVAVATPALAEPAIDADRYRTDGGDYAFVYRYDGGKRMCSVSADPTTVRCGISAPAGTRITVKGRSVRPEAIEITARGWRYLEKITSQDRPRMLPEGARLSVHGASCTSIRDGGLECSIDSVGFKQDDGRFSTHGTKAG
ncbi:hypothetical protein [Tsukamurella sp. NPDC003166]|uniref:hypothetical protein n=1 Tax=Tsukamurella sp. NPDC003166 TaxID=3154444 RepID=UPI0033B55335